MEPPPSSRPPPPPPRVPPLVNPSAAGGFSGVPFPARPLPPPPPRGQSKLVAWLSSLGAVGFLLLKFGGKLKFLLPALKFLGPALKTGGTMLLSIGVYALAFGWKFAVGFVLLIFVHEMGHVFAARQAGIKVTAPTFIPFIGAHILLQQALPNAWVEAKIGYAGPLAGTLAAAACHGVWLATGNPFWAALAYTGYFLNLFNLAPAGPLDGGRITAAISPLLWVVGYVVLGAWLAWDIRQAVIGAAPAGSGIFLIVLILVSGLPRLFWLFRRDKSDAERRYFQVPAGKRLLMSAAYFGLIAALGVGMALTHIKPETLRPPQSVAALAAVP